MRITERQRRFVDYYLELGNQAQAAIKAGYSKKYAAENAGKILKNTNAKAYYEQRLKEIESRRIADVKEVMEYLTSVMRGEESEDVIVIEGCGKGYSKARNINKSVSAKDRLKAAELLSKRLDIVGDSDESAVNIIDDIN